MDLRYGSMRFTEQIVKQLISVSDLTIYFIKYFTGWLLCIKEKKRTKNDNKKEKQFAKRITKEERAFRVYFSRKKSRKQENKTKITRKKKY